MCKLQLNEYGCGHVRKTLLEACETHKRLAPVAGTRAPTFCLNGLHVVQRVPVEGSCIRQHKGLTCQQVKALCPLKKRFDEIEAVLTSYRERGAQIKRLIQPGYQPAYNWDQVVSEGLDETSIKMLEDRQVELRSVTIPEYLDNFAYKLNRCGVELHAVYDYNVKQVLAEASGLGISPSPEVAKMLDEANGWYVADFDSSDYSDFNAREWFIIDGPFEKLRDAAHDALLFVEHLALDACLDDVGWELPQDPEDHKELLHVMYDRRLMPVNKSRTEPRPGWRV
ncbi:hypothetical protein BDV95DRAFT_568560 [Massariosphaeria phaeospora]|uniref:Uncharacterized protein n=1 Tax=Massariosphaeria phaeospora TaxID=100035 RepID=A0A7C8ME38_9PLEO|nr:hypothetical protein BDV95DRAFT_568560 [Massariosphaeria phaeospora]